VTGKSFDYGVASFLQEDLYRVILTLQAYPTESYPFVSMPAGAFFSEFSFNFKASGLSNLTIAQVVGDSTVTATSIEKGLNAFKADGDGYYDIRIGFSTASNDSNRFTAGDTAVFRITRTTSGNLSIDDFNDTSSGQHPVTAPDGFVLAAKVQGLTGASEWLNLGVAPEASAVPEPATIVIWSLLAAGTGLGAGLSRRRRTGRRWSPENRQAILRMIESKVRH
jgi:hypothetical protein